MTPAKVYTEMKLWINPSQIEQQKIQSISLGQVYYKMGLQKFTRYIQSKKDWLSASPSFHPRRDSSLTRYRLTPKLALRSISSFGSIFRYFRPKLVSPK